MTIRQALLVLLLITVVIESGSLLAGVNQWTSGGPYGADELWTIAVDPLNSSNVYVATTGGVYRSTDSGVTWQPAREGLRDIYGNYPTITAFAFDPVSTGTIYAGTGASNSSGPFKTTDAGAHWLQINSGLAAGENIGSMAIDPNNPSVLLGAYSGGGVYKSIDGGAHWADSSQGLVGSARTVNKIVAVTTNPTIFFVGTNGAGVYKSTNGGATWEAANTGNVYVWSLAKSASSPGVLYAGVQQASGMEVIKTTDGGATPWTVVNASLWGIDIAVDPTDPSRAYVAAFDGNVYRTADGGVTWNGASGLSTYQNRAIAIDSSNVATLYLGKLQWEGVLKSSDSGVTWSPTSNGLASRDARSVAVSPTDPTRVYAAISGYAGVFRSTDRGSSWLPANTGITPSSDVETIAVSPTDPHVAYAGTANGEVFQTIDGGDTWASRSNGLPGTGIQRVVTHPTDPLTLFAVTGAIYRTTNGAASWVPLTGLPGSVYNPALAIDLSTPSTIYISVLIPKYGYVGESRLYRSTDNGDTWTEVSVTPGFLTRLVVSPTQPLTLFGVTTSTVVKSADGGVTWGGGFALPPGNGLFITATSPPAIYVGTNASGVYRSVDGGTTWQTSNCGLGDFLFREITGDLNGRYIFAATSTGSVQNLEVVTPVITQTTGSNPSCNGMPVTLDAGGGYAGYLWSTGDTTQTITVSPSTTTLYSVQVAGAPACSDLSPVANFTVTVYPLIPVVSTQAAVGARSPNRVASVANHAGSSYLWTIGNGTITSGQGTSQITFTAGIAGTLTLGVVETDSSGCASAQASITVTVAPAGSAALFYTLTPCRVLDTRNPTGPLGGPPLQPGATRTFDMATSACRIPAGAVAISANLTVTNVGTQGELVVFPSDISRPNASTLTFRAGRTRANNAIISLSSSTATFSIFNNSAATVDFILDVNAYFE
jgi:photosystem II stability/assembly factor-like uncharacterized protein